MFICQLHSVSETCDRFEMETIAEESQMGRGDSSDSSDFDSDENSDDNDSDTWTDDSTSNSNSSIQSNRTSTASSAATIRKTELHKQNELRNNLSIVGIPHVRNENLRSMFLNVCKLLGSPITNDAIRHIWRDTARQVVNIELRDHNVKSHICKFSHARYLWTDDLMRLPPDMVRSRIYINDQMTHFYKQMWEIGRQARKCRLIYTSWISDRGFMVKQTAASKRRYFLSAIELNRYVDRLRKMKLQNRKKMNKKKTSTPIANKHRPFDFGSMSSTSRDTKRRRVDTCNR